MGLDKDHMVVAHAAQQHGVFSYVQARAVGFSARQIQHRIARGLWVRVHDEALAVAGAPLSWKGRLVAACFAGGARAVAGYRSAAAVWDLPGGRQDVVEIVCPRWRRARHEGLVVHEIERLRPEDCTVVDGVPVTGPELTLLHLGAALGPTLVEMALQRALARELVTLDSCDDLLYRYSRPGRNGLVALRLAVARLDPRQRPTESEMETRLLQTIRELGLPAPVTQYEVRRPDGSFVARLDAAYPAQRVGIEYQSLAHHTLEHERRRDRARVHGLRAMWWDILEVGPDDLSAGGRRRFGDALRVALLRAG